jgi:hypothetical protein
MTDFMVDHAIIAGDEASVIDKTLWSLYFDGSVCIRWQGVGCVIVSPSGMDKLN